MSKFWKRLCIIAESIIIFSILLVAIVGFTSLTIWLYNQKFLGNIALLILYIVFLAACGIVLIEATRKAVSTCIHDWRELK